MKRLTISIGIVAFLVVGANATVINIPDDYPTIQQGINHGAEGDTVLVQPDTYYENLNFSGHNVVLASLFVITGDTTYISSTAIDGDSAGSVITFSSGEQSSAQVVGFTIQNGYNCAGGGICCSFSHPTISHNTIQGNSTGAYGYGGGIYCEETNGVLRDNIIRDNHTGDNGYGGGIYCAWCAPTINSNTVTGNSAGSWGGGLCCVYANSTLEKNSISGNSAPWGGGILCSNSSIPISNSTSSTNTAEWGGGLCCFDCRPTITNMILWGDTASHGAEIFAEGRDPTVTYCDVQGGWPGEGNIDADPVFAGPYNGDFYLRWRSPCIDAGDPNSPLDPDGTRPDMGAFYFNQDVPGIVELYPENTPIVIPPEGGDIVYDGWVFNFLGHPGRADIWSFAFVPGMGRYGPIDLYRNFRIPADSIGRNDIRQSVPGLAPPGEYVFVAYIGDYPSTVIDSSYFYLIKTGSVVSGIASRFEGNEWLKESNLMESGLPSDYGLSQNHPNPFNASTTINYQLPINSDVKVEVYNLLGQKVATLADSKQQAGYRSIIWDASTVSSGLYFYRLTAGDYTDTRRMILVK
jgi:hypothetical protein